MLSAAASSGDGVCVTQPVPPPEPSSSAATPYPDATSSEFGVPRSSPPPAAGSSAVAPLDVEASGSSCAIHYAFDKVVIEDVFDDEDEDYATPLSAEEADRLCQLRAVP
jgi:hypothetical protein